MKLYKLSYVMYDPSESTEPDKFMAEIPSLPGCRAWGETPAETLYILESLASIFIESYVELGDPLPHGIESTSVDSDFSNELTVAV